MENKEKNFVSAVVYVHNAEKRIETFLKTVIEVLEGNFECSEILCVNDGSVDNSTEIIRKIGRSAETTSISVINMSCFHGLETAMNAGLDLAIGDFVFEFDNIFLDYGKEEIMRVYLRALQGYDIVSASSDRKQKASSKMFYYVFAKFAGAKTSMSTESFRILSRRVINRIKSMNKTIPYRKAVYANCGLKTDNMQYSAVCADNLKEKDKTEKRYRSALAVDSLILFTDVGYSFAKIMTFLMIFSTVFMALYSVVIYLIGTPVAGWTTTILFLSFSFFGLFGILTIIIKYLQIIVNLVFRRKRYSFESIEKLTK